MHVKHNLGAMNQPYWSQRADDSSPTLGLKQSAIMTVKNIKISMVFPKGQKAHRLHTSLQINVL